MMEVTGSLEAEDELGELEERSLWEQYEDFDFEQPPVQAQVPRRKYEYPEKNEGALFEFQAEVFDMGDTLSAPHESELNPTWENLQRHKLKFQEIVKTVAEIRKANRQTREAIGKQLDLPFGELRRPKRELLLSKELRRQFFSEKRNYLHSLIAHLNVCEYGKTGAEAQELKFKITQAEIILETHHIYSLVRSYIHSTADSKRFRDDKSATVSHLYEVCVHAGQPFLKLIKEEKDPAKKLEYIKEMRRVKNIALLHDFPEDHGEYKLGEFKRKVDFYISAPEPTISQPYNGFYETKEVSAPLIGMNGNEWRALTSGAKSLAKPSGKTAAEKESARKGYMEKQLGHDSGLIHIKVADRINNLATLRYMKDKIKDGKLVKTAAVRQKDKIESTFEIFELIERRIPRESKDYYKGILMEDGRNLFRVMKEQTQILKKKVNEKNPPEIEEEIFLEIEKRMGPYELAFGPDLN